MEQYALTHIRLEIVQGGAGPISTETLRAAVLEEFYKRSEEKLQTLEDSLRTLERALVSLRSDEILTASLASEVAVLYPTIRGIAVRQMVLHHPETPNPDTLTVALVELDRPTSKQLAQLEQWLRARTRQPNLRVVVLK
jgi:hypothetical protein